MFAPFTDEEAPVVHVAEDIHVEPKAQKDCAAGACKDEDRPRRLSARFTNSLTFMQQDCHIRNR